MVDLDTPERYVNSDAIDRILARVVAQALADYRANRYCPGKPSARDFLVAMGIVLEDGSIDWCGHRVPPPRPARRPPALRQPREEK